MNSQNLSLKYILEWLTDSGYDYEFRGDVSKQITSFSSLSQYKDGSITWIKSQKNVNEYVSNGGDIMQIVCTVVEADLDVGLPCMIRAVNSKAVFFAILHGFWGEKCEKGKIGKGTVISLSPAYFGDTCTAKVTVNEVINEAKGIYRLRTIVENQNGKLLLDGNAVVKYQKETSK